MSVSGAGEVSFGLFSEIVDAFRGDEVLVVNDTRVVPARLYGHKKNGGRVEVFFLEPLSSNTFSAMTRGKIKTGNVVELPLGVEAMMLDRDEHGYVVFSIDWGEGGEREKVCEGERHERVCGDQDYERIWSWLERAGEVPLPPYIKRTPDGDDLDRYQTVYASTPGAVAAPTAGLHFTSALLKELMAKGVEVCPLTLHVGLGTFLPVKVKEIKDHVMHSERYHLPFKTRGMLRSGRPIIAVGTTAVRALESFAHAPNATRTEIFIYPGYEFRVIDGLITNFHLPQSTLLMLVSALAGHQTTLAAYQRAIEQELRFYSYGDASLFRKPKGRWDR